MILRFLPAILYVTSRTTWYSVGLALGILLIAVACVFIWKNKGSAGEAEVQGPFGLGLKKASAAVVMLAFGCLGVGGSIYQLGKGEGAPADTVVLSHITKLENVPPKPILNAADSKRERVLKIGKWYLSFFQQVQIVVDRGTNGRIAPGDYFATIYDEDKAKDLPNSQIANLQDELTSLIRVVTVYPKLSVCRLDEFAYEKFFSHYGDQLAPVLVGQAVVAVPRDEKALRDEIASEEERHNYQIVVEKAERFLFTHPNAFFGGDVLFKKGVAQFELKDYDEAARTFKLYLDRYPFHPSATAAQEWEERAERAEERQGTRPGGAG